MAEFIDRKLSRLRVWRRPSQRLLFSALVTVIVVVLLASFTLVSLDNYRRQIAVAEEEVQVKARLLATAHDQWLSEMENMTAAMAAALKGMPDMQQGCSELFGDYLAISKGIDTVLLVAPNGDLLCASTPMPKGINFSDRRYFQRAMAEKRFSVGNFIVGRVSGKRVLPMALPVLGDDGEVEFLVVLGRTLNWIGAVLERQYISGDIDITVLDGDGTVLAHGPDDSLVLEQLHPVAAVQRAVWAEGSEAFTAMLHGEETIFALTRLGPESSDVFVMASRPASRTLQPTLDIIRDNLMQLLATMLVIIAALWIGIGHWILKPLQKLADAMGRVRAGGTGERVEKMGPSQELIEIGDNFNDMLFTLEETSKRMKRLADQDALLHIPNRRLLDERLHNEWRRLARTHEPLCLLMVDVDLFKRYNDHYGHQEGDDCLKRVTAVLRSALRRPADMVARYGGEEFVLLLPETDEAGAVNIAEDIHARMAEKAIPHEASDVADYVTVSIGLACSVPTPSQHVDELLERADKALYRAKDGGRNRTETG